jgi:hypothetical protein
MHRFWYTHVHVSVPTSCVYLSSTSFRFTTNIQFPLLFIAALGIMNSVLVGQSWLFAACLLFLGWDCSCWLLPVERVYLHETNRSVYKMLCNITEYEIVGSRSSEDVDVLLSCESMSPPSGLKMETVCFYEKLVSTYESTRHQSPEEH